MPIVWEKQAVFELLFWEQTKAEGEVINLSLCHVTPLNSLHPEPLKKKNKTMTRYQITQCTVWPDCELRSIFRLSFTKWLLPLAHRARLVIMGYRNNSGYLWTGFDFFFFFFFVLTTTTTIFKRHFSLHSRINALQWLFFLSGKTNGAE